MDWLKLELCAIIWVLCVSKSYSQALTNTEPVCTQGQSIPSPDKCNQCICFEGQIHCTHVVCPSNDTATDQECQSNADISQTDSCNVCMCYKGQIACTNLICIPAPQCVNGKQYPPPNKCNTCTCQNGVIVCTNNNCDAVENRFGNSNVTCIEGQHFPSTISCIECGCVENLVKCWNTCARHGPECYEGQPAYKPDECNECYCVGGKFECSDLVCIRGSQCSAGEVIPKPDNCNSCTCVDGHVLCTNHQCPKIVSKDAFIPETTTEPIGVLPLNYECQDGDVIPPIPPPNDCNECICLENTILCTQKNCLEELPDINGRFKVENEQKVLEDFDKKISMEPFINMLYKNYHKIPTKLIHTHAYNGFHQEIKVHSKKLPKDTSELLKALASSLDNPALAGIGDKLSSSPDLLLNNHGPKTSIVLHAEQNSPQIHLVEGDVLQKKPLESPDLFQSSKLITSGSQSNETILLVPNMSSHDIQTTQSVVPLTNKYETYRTSVASPAPIIIYKNTHQNEPSVVSSTQQDKFIRNPKFGRPGQHNIYPTGPSRNTENKFHNSQKPVPPINPTPTNNNMVSNAPFPQDDKQYKPITPNILSQHDKLRPDRPYQITEPANHYIADVMSSYPIPNLGQEQHFTTIFNNGSQQNPPKSHFEPAFIDMSKLNRPPPEHKPDEERHLPTLNNNGYFDNPHQFNRTTLPSNQYYPSESRFKQKPPHYKFGPKPTVDNSNPLFPPQNGQGQYKPDPTSAYSSLVTHNNSPHSQSKIDPAIPYTYQYKSPEIRLKPGQEQLNPHSTISYTQTVEYNPPETVLALDQDKGIHPHEGNPYNKTHSHYETHSTITYNNQFDPPPVEFPSENNHFIQSKWKSDHDSYAPRNETTFKPFKNRTININPDNDKTRNYLSSYSKQKRPRPNPNERQNKTLQGQSKISDDNQYSSLVPSTLKPTQSDEDLFKNKVNNYLSAYPNQRPREKLQDQSTTSEYNQSNPHGPWANQYDPSQTAQKESTHLSAQFNQRPREKDQDPSKKSEHNQSKPRNPWAFQYDPSQTAQNDQPHLSAQFNQRPREKDQDPSKNSEHNQSKPRKPWVNQYNPSETAQNDQPHLSAQFNQRPREKNQNPSKTSEYNQSKPRKPWANQYDPSQTAQNDQPHLSAQFNQRPREKDQDPSKNSEHNQSKPRKPWVNQYNPSETAQNDQPHLLAQFNQRPREKNQNPSKTSEYNQSKPRKPWANQYDPSQTAQNDQPHLSAQFNQRPREKNQDPSKTSEYNQSKPRRPWANQYDPSQTAQNDQPQLSAQFNQRPREKNQDPSKTSEYNQPNPRGPSDNQYDPSQTTQNDQPHLLAQSNQRPREKDQDPSKTSEYNQSKARRPWANQYDPSQNDQPHLSAQSNQRPREKNQDESKTSEYNQSNPRGPSDNQYRPSQTRLHRIPLNRTIYNNPDNIYYKREEERFKNKIEHYLSSHSKQKRPGHNPNEQQNKTLQGQSKISEDNQEPGSVVKNDFKFYPKLNMTTSTRRPKINYHVNSKLNLLQDQLNPGVFDDRGSDDGFQYISYSAEDLAKVIQFQLQQEDPLIVNQFNYPQSQFKPSQNRPLPGPFDDRASADGFQYISNSAEDPTKVEQLKPSHSPFKTSQNRPMSGAFGDFGSADPSIPKVDEFNPPSSQFKFPQDQQNPGTFDDRGSADGFQYISNSAEDKVKVIPFKLPQEDPLIINQFKSPQSQIKPSKNRPWLGAFDERVSTEEFTYVSNSFEDPTKVNQHKLSQQGPSKVNKFKLPQAQFKPSQNKPLPGPYVERGSAVGYPYISNSAKNRTKQNHHKPSQDAPSKKNPHYLFNPSQKSSLTGPFDDRGSADGFQYISYSAEDPTKVNQHKLSEEDPSKVNQFKLPQNQFKHSQNRPLSGPFDERGSPVGYPYITHSAEDLTKLKQHKPPQKDPSKKIPHYQFNPSQNSPMSGPFDDRGSADGFQYISYSAEDPTKVNQHKLSEEDTSKVNQFKLPQNQFKPSQNKPLPGPYVERGSAVGYPYISNSAKNRTKQNHHKPSQDDPSKKNPHYPFNPSQKSSLTGTFDDRGSADGFQYISYSAEDPTKVNQHKLSEEDPSKVNQFKLPQNQFKPSQNRPLLGPFDERGSPVGYPYITHSAEDLTKLKQHKPPQKDPSKKIPHYQFNPSQNSPMSGPFDDRGSADGFQYISYSAEDPTKVNQHKLSEEDPSKVNQFKLPQNQFKPSQNRPLSGPFDERGSLVGYPYITHSAEDLTKLKQHKPPQKDPSKKIPHYQFNPSQNSPMSGPFDDRGSADGFQYISYSAEDPTKVNQHKLSEEDPSKVNQFKLPQNQFKHSQNRPLSGPFDERGSAVGYPYISHSDEDPTKLNQLPPQKDPSKKIPHYQFNPSQNSPMSGPFDDRGSADGFQYISYSAEDPTKINQHKLSEEDPSKVNQFKLPQNQFKPSQNRPLSGPFDERGSPVGYPYITHSAEDPTKLKQHKPPQKDPSKKIPHYQFNPSQNSPISGPFDDRGSADGFQYISNSAEDPSILKVNKLKPSYSQLTVPQSQTKPESFDDRGSADGFQYISNSGEDPTTPNINPFTPLEPQFKVPQVQPWSVDDREDPSIVLYKSSVKKLTILHNDHYKLGQSRFGPKQNQSEQLTNSRLQIKPDDQNDFSSTDVNSIRWSIPGDHNTLSNSNKGTSSPQSVDQILNGNLPILLMTTDNIDALDSENTTPPFRLKPEKDQYSPSSVDNIFNGFHQIPWFALEGNVKASDKNSSTVKSDQVKYELSPAKNLAWPKTNNADKNKLQPDQEKSTLTTELDSDSNELHYRFKPDGENDAPLSDSKHPNYGNQYESANIIAPKKQSKRPPMDYPKFAVGATEVELDNLPYLFPGIFKNKPLPDDDQIKPSDMSKTKHQQLPINYNSVPHWLASDNNLIPTSYNGTVTIGPPSNKLKSKYVTDEATTKTMDLVSKFKALPQKNLQTTIHPHTESMNKIKKTPGFMDIPTVPEDSRNQPSAVRYPDVHIMIHNAGNDIIPQLIENGGMSPVPDINQEESIERIVGSFLPRMLHPRFRYRPKDQKEECGEGTEWISNCHGCSCYGGQAICFQIPDCHLRPFGEPMICKPYSHFKMGACYSCECNGDGVAECDATDCGKTETNDEQEQVKDSNGLALPVFNEFFDEKKTFEILEYYRVYKKLPKDCTSKTLYPTCEVGTSWSSSCQKCQCNEKGQHECTLIEDCKLDYESHGTPGRCKPNSKFYPKTTNMPCVECTCDDEGNPYCPSVDQKKH